MKTESCKYKDVHVTTYIDEESGIIRFKFFSILSNKAVVRDRLAVMCLKHDLVYMNTSDIPQGASVMCKLRSFKNINEFIEYVKYKANNKAYSFRIKGEYALTKIGDKKYIYRILPSSKDNNESIKDKN